MEMTAEALQEKDRELADMVGSVVVDEALPLETLEAVADCLKEDCRQIRQAVQDMQEEQRGNRENDRRKGGVAWQAKRKGTR